MKKRLVQDNEIQTSETMESIGLKNTHIAHAINYTYDLFDTIDNALISKSAPRLAKLIDLTSLSSILGNFLTVGIENSTNRLFHQNRPNKFPDLLHAHSSYNNVEIKIALNKNKPKGHLPKSCYYLTFRYYLGLEDHTKTDNKNCSLVWIWETRFGYLNESDFNFSSTSGDSGKTAPIKLDSWKNMDVIYLVDAI